MAIWKEGKHLSWYAELGNGLNLSVFYNPRKLDPDRPYEARVFGHHTTRAATREEAQQAAEGIARKALSQALAALDAKDDGKDGETMSNDTTQHTPADVRDRIIRASILPFEDEETMIAGLRAGAEAVERGELDVDDFVGVWSQYLRQLLRASSVPAPADVRELAVEIIRSLDLIARNYDSYEYGLPVMTHYDEMVDTVVALLRTPRGEEEGEAQLWRKVGEEPPPNGVQVLVYDPRPDGYSYAGCWAYTLIRKGDQFYLDGERCDEEDRSRLRIEEWLWQPLPPYPGSRSKDDDVRDAALRSEAQGEG